MTSGLMVHIETIKRMIASRLAFRTDLLLSAATMAINEALSVLLIMVIYANSEGFAGWKRDEAILLQGTFILTSGIAAVFFTGIIWNTLRKVEAGELDLLLLQPRSSLHRLIATGFDTEDMGRVIAGSIIVIYCGYQLGPFSIPQIALYFAYIGLGLLTLLGLAMICSGLAIRFVKTWRMYEILDSIFMLGEYPATVSQPIVRAMISFVVPVITIAYLPVSALLGYGVAYQGAITIATLLFAGISYLFWDSSMRAYTSAGG